MSKAKKLNLSIEQLVEITKELNANILANRTKPQEERISTDIFIRKFGITRKDFSETLKDTPIKYNTSTFLYEIPSNYLSNTQVSRPPQEEHPHKIENVNQSNTEVNHIYSELQELLKLKKPLKEMLQWYKGQLDKSIDEPPVLNINNNERLKGEVVTKSFKLYKEVHDEFVKFVSKRKETQKDLLSLAMLEFIKKYDR